MISGQALASLDRQQLQDLLYGMLQIRRFEEKAAEMYARGRIRGFLHLYIGQEAVAAGVFPLLEQRDYIFSHYREHGHALARGVEPKTVMAELFGKATGVTGGLGGSMHLFDASRNFMGGYAIVGGHMPLACGAALSSLRLGKGAIVLCIIGDGAVNEGAFHESLNLAALWKLPVLFLLENNLYGMGTPITRASAIREIYKHAQVYGVRAESCDGMDVMDVREHARQAIDHVRAGDGPYFLEAMTYRFRGHSMADPELYRDKAEVERWRQMDPIQRFSRALTEGGHVTQEEIDALKVRVEQEVEEAVRFAEDSPLPALEVLEQKVYVESGRSGADRA